MSLVPGQKVYTKSKTLDGGYYYQKWTVEKHLLGHFVFMSGNDITYGESVQEFLHGNLISPGEECTESEYLVGSIE